jgi:putative transposase
MPRRARIAVAGFPWHIVQRGNNRSLCFFSDSDRLVYLERLELVANKFGCAIHAYCLMSNHVHLLLTPEESDAPGLMMKHLGQFYVQYINRAYERSGTLWEGRYKSCVAQDDAYLLSCYRYIELNPVRAGMVAYPEDYAWSSFRCNGLGHTNTLISPHRNYLGLGESTNGRCAVYRSYVCTREIEGVDDRIRQATQRNLVLE